MKNYKYLFFIFLIIFLTACSRYSLESRVSLANSLALKNSLIKKDINTSSFILRTYGKIENKNKALKVYIEGDGLAWINSRTISNDPTPINPIALKLASKDKSANIIYIARPCQYNLKENNNCNNSYWSKKRFSKEVIASYNEALNRLKKKYGFEKIELIGFSGGGAVATLVASKRDDIIKIVTIAGNLNHKLVNKIHKVSQMKESLNPIDIASKISYIPQVHYVGESDTIIPIAVVNSFKKAAKYSKNIEIKIINNATHTKGWDELIIK